MRVYGNVLRQGHGAAARPSPESAGVRAGRPRTTAAAARALASAAVATAQPLIDRPENRRHPALADLLFQQIHADLRPRRDNGAI